MRVKFSPCYKLFIMTKTKYGYCPYCKRYIGSGYIAVEHKKLCKNVTPEVRNIHGGE